MQVDQQGTLSLKNGVDKAQIHKLVIPDELTGIRVKQIGYNVFYNCSSLTSVTLPTTITTIGTSAFNYCTSLVSIALPNSLTTIDGGAFNMCTSLISITFPSSLTTVGINAFSSCYSLKFVTIPSTITTIGNNAFSSCSSLTSITYTTPSSVENETYVLVDEKGDAITDPNTTTTITNGFLTKKKYVVGAAPIQPLACIGKLAIGDIKIPASTSSIDNTFSYCASIKTIIFPSALTTISDYAFQDCHSLNSITGAYTQDPTSFSNDAFSSINANALICTVRNTDSNYSSSTFLTFLQSKGLPAAG